MTELTRHIRWLTTRSTGHAARTADIIHDAAGSSFHKITTPSHFTFEVTLFSQLLPAHKSTEYLLPKLRTAQADKSRAKPTLLHERVRLCQPSDTRQEEAPTDLDTRATSSRGVERESSTIGTDTAKHPSDQLATVA